MTTENTFTILASHSDSVLSAEQVRRVLENGRNSILLTESVCPRRVYRHRKLFKSHTLAALSIEQLARKSPQLCQLTHQTEMSKQWKFMVNSNMLDTKPIRQICNVKPQDTVTTRSSELLARLGIEDLDLILKERRLCWYGHVERSNGAVRTAFDMQVDGKCGPGRPKITWKQLTERDCREWKLSAIDIHDRHIWRSGVRSAMHAASQLPGRGSTDVDVVPVPAC